MNESPVLLHIREIPASEEPAAVERLQQHGTANIVFRFYNEVARYG